MRHPVEEETQPAPGRQTEHEYGATDQRRSSHWLAECTPQPDHNHPEVESHHGAHDVSEVCAVNGDAEEKTQTN